MFQGPHTSSEFKEMAETHTVLRCQVGSGLHGLAIEGTDDRDEIGICIEPPEYLLGLKRFEQYEFRTQPQGVRSGPGDLDLNIYSLRKFVRLAVHGNPTTILPLFAPDSEIMMINGWGEGVRSQLRQWIMTKETAKRFLGYMTAQREQMLGLRAGRRHTNRPELVEVYGFDTKFASHMCRLGFQGLQLLTTGQITLPMPDPELEWLRDLKVGKHTQEEALEVAEALEEKIRFIISDSSLPNVPDMTPVNEFLVEVYQGYWEEQGL